MNFFIEKAATLPQSAAANFFADRKNNNSLFVIGMASYDKKIPINDSNLYTLAEDKAKFSREKYTRPSVCWIVLVINRKE